MKKGVILFGIILFMSFISACSTDSECGYGENCCEGYCVIENCQETVRVAFWADINKRQITTDYHIIQDMTQLILVLDNSGLSSGDSIDFIIKESDLGMDDTIKILTAYVDEDGSAEATWLVTTEDLEKGASSSDGIFDENSIYELGEFYFEVDGEPSGVLHFSVIEIESFCRTIGFCRDYTLQGDCEIDICEVSNDSVEVDYGSNICEKITSYQGCEVSSDCSCKWENGKCGPNKKDLMKCNGTLSEIGECFYDEYYNDNCEDGFLVYSWEGIYNWNENNTFGSEKAGAEGYVEEPTGVWHYDPERKNEKCVEGNNIVQCPDKALLPSFNFINIIVILIVIGIVYYFISKNKKTKRRKKSSRRKK